MKHIAVFIFLLIFLAACSNPNIPSAGPSSQDAAPSQEIAIPDREEWPLNSYTEGIPVPAGTVSWTALDTKQGNCTVSITDVLEQDYHEYLQALQQAGFSEVESISEEIEGEGYVSNGALLSDGKKWVSISYIPEHLTVYISEEH